MHGADRGWGPDTGRTVPPGQRGRLRIADRVLTRIAWVAAREALAAAAGAAVAPGEAPRVSVSVSGGSARVRVGVDLPFPSDLTVLAAAVQEAVAERVGELTGVPTREVVVVVERLLPPAAGAQVEQP